MSENISKEDQDWLDSLAGTPPKDADPLISAQALAVREALAKRRDAIEADATRVGTSGLDVIRARLQREGLMDAAETVQPKNSWWERVTGIVGLGSDASRPKTAPIWGAVATLVLAILVAYQIPRTEPEDEMTFRGDPNAATLIVENPEVRAKEIVAGMKVLSSEPIEMIRFKDGTVLLKVRDSEPVQEYLLAQRVEAVAVDGIIKIYVVPEKK